MTDSLLQEEALADILKTRTRQLAREQQSAAEAQLWVLRFHVGDETMNMLVGKLRSVGNIGRLLRLPHGDPNVLGVCHVKDGVLPIFDLRATMGLPLQRLPERAQVLWLGDERAEFGLSVHAIVGLDSMAKSSLRPVPDALEAAFRDWLVGVDANGAPIFDSERLYVSPRFYVVSKRAAHDDKRERANES